MKKHHRHSEAMAFCVLRFAVALLASCSWPVANAGGSPLRLLSASPAHLHVGVGYTNLTFTCKADAPLADCQFRLRNEVRKRNGPVLELGLGSASPTNRSFLTRDLLWYHYSGEGLDRGSCGVTLYVKGVKQYTVGCRVRAEDSGWRYGLMSLYAENYAAVPLQVTPMQQVAVGGEISLMCKAGKQLNTCRFYLPGFGEVIMDGGRESPSPSTHHYYGAGLEQGDCGLTLKAKETNNGMLWCTVDTSRRDLEWNTIPLIVTRAPEKVTLDVLDVSVTEHGAVFLARCVVSGGRPAPAISWLLGEDQLRADAENDDANATWTWPYHSQEQVQLLNVTVRPGVASRTLTCRAHHPDLSEPLSASTELLSDAMQCAVPASQGVEASCQLDGQEVDCTAAGVGSVATLSCKPGYTAANPPGDQGWLCLLGGVWNQTLLQCVPDCGKLSNGSYDEHSEDAAQPSQAFPWHVGIYEEKGDNFHYTCGGSILSPKYVISAAQCFWDPDQRQKRQAVEFRVRTGLPQASWDAEGEGGGGPAAQRRAALRFVFHDRFNGFEGRFQYDVALVQVDEPFALSADVAVVCLDWDNLWAPAPPQHLLHHDNPTGLVVGPGLGEAARVVRLGLLSNASCAAQIPERSRPMLTADKLCARAAPEDGGLCKGDAGGGLVLRDPPSAGKFFLRGVASVGFPTSSSADACQEHYIVGFTSVAAYIDWIKDVV